MFWSTDFFFLAAFHAYHSVQYPPQVVQLPSSPLLNVSFGCLFSASPLCPSHSSDLLDSSPALLPVIQPLPFLPSLPPSSPPLFPFGQLRSLPSSSLLSWLCGIDFSCRLKYMVTSIRGLMTSHFSLSLSLTLCVCVCFSGCSANSTEPEGKSDSEGDSELRDGDDRSEEEKPVFTGGLRRSKRQVSFF